MRNEKCLRKLFLLLWSQRHSWEGIAIQCPFHPIDTPKVNGMQTRQPFLRVLYALLREELPDDRYFNDLLDGEKLSPRSEIGVGSAEENSVGMIDPRRDDAPPEQIPLFAQGFHAVLTENIPQHSRID